MFSRNDGRNDSTILKAAQRKLNIMIAQIAVLLCEGKSERGKHLKS